jgi:hypothetical protein
MMIHRATLLLLAVPMLSACSASSMASAPSATPSHVVASSCQATPRSGGSSVFELPQFKRVQSVSCMGRVPLGPINATNMLMADAWFDRFFAGDDLPQSATLHLSVVLGAHFELAIDGSSGASYEWWFYTGPQTDAPTATAAHNPRVKLSVRFVAGSWGVYADVGAGIGWQPVPLSSFQFGNHELSAIARIDPAWGMNRDASTFFRAVTVGDGSFTDDASGQPTRIGDVFPADLSWRQVFDY